MLNKHAMIVPAMAVAMAVGTTAPAWAECDMAALTEVVSAAGVSADDGAMAAVKVVEFYTPNACAVGRRDVAMVRGMMSDAYGALDGDDAKMAMMAAKGLVDSMMADSCDKDGEPLKVLDQCSLDDVQKAAGGG